MSGSLAPRWRRLLATGIDAVLVPALTVVLVMGFDIAEDAEDYQDLWWIAHVLVLAIASYLALNGYWLFTHGQTVGKKILGLSVRSATNPAEVAAFWRLVVLRAWFFAAIFLVIPPLVLLPLIDHLPIFSRRRRCLHDWIAGTVVVRV